MSKSAVNTTAQTSTIPLGGTTVGVSEASTTYKNAEEITQNVSRAEGSKIINENDPQLNTLLNKVTDSIEIKSHISEVNSFQNYLGIDLAGSKGEVSDIEALAASTIFGDLEEQSELLGNLFPGEKSKAQSEFLSYDERFKKEVTEKEMEFLPVIKAMENPFDIKESDLGSPEELDALKLQKDRALLSQIVRQAKREIADNKTFRTLKANIDRLQEWKSIAISLIDRYQESKVNLLELCKKMVDYAEEMSAAEQDRKEIINFLKDKLHLTTQQCQQDQRYSRAFYEARNDHSSDILNYELKVAEANMRSMEIEMSRDKFCHRNVEDYFELVFWETQKKIDYWNAKFDKDLEAIDKKVREKQDSIRNQQNQIESLNKMIDERMVELGPWEDQQRREKELRSDYLRLFFSARKIQRWWREYMVKHKLYKKKKGKKGKGPANDPTNEPVDGVRSQQQSAKSRTLSATTTTT